MKFVISLFLIVSMIAVAATCYVCIRDKITAEDLMNRFSNIVTSAAGTAGETIVRVVDQAVDFVIHVEVGPLTTGPALVQIVDAQSKALTMHYNGFSIDTTYKSIKQTWTIPWWGGEIDWVDKDIEVSLWSYSPGSVPVYFDLSEFGSEDIQIDTTSDNLQITLTLPDAEIGRCRINHQNVEIELVESKGMSTEEQHEYVSEIYLTAMSQACEEIELQALASGVIEQARVQFTNLLTEALNGIYPDADICITFRTETHLLQGNK